MAGQRVWSGCFALLLAAFVFSPIVGERVNAGAAGAASAAGAAGAASAAGAAGATPATTDGRAKRVTCRACDQCS